MYIAPAYALYIVAYKDASDKEAFMLWIKFYSKNSEVCFEGGSPKWKGLVTPFYTSPGTKVLHMNWNWIKPPKNNLIWREHKPNSQGCPESLELT